MHARALLLSLMALGGAAALVGCAGDDDSGGRVSVEPTAEPEEAPATTSDPSPTTSADATTPATSAGPMTGGGLEPASAAAQGEGTALLRAVRAAKQDGYDRVVFEFSGSAVPGFQVGYSDGEITQDGSGSAVDVAGEEALTVRLEPAADADLTQADAPRTYPGPDRIDPDTPQVAEVVRVGGFEGVLSWAIGTASRTNFDVTTLQNPPRVVVDISHQ